MSYQRTMRGMLFVSVLILATLACNLTAAQQTDIDLAVTQTLAARVNESAGGSGPEDDQAAPDQPATDEPQPPSTDTSEPQPPTATATSTKVPTATATEIPCDRVTFVSDVTVPDGTDFDPGETFVKTWRLRNTGSCTWTSSYDLVFYSGDQMGAPSSVQLTSGTVPPGSTVDASVQLKAPNSGGTYKGFFRLRSGSDVIFGIGDSGTVSFWVEIEVIEDDDPDLVVEEINFDPYPPTKNDSVVVRVKVRNNGGETEETFTIKWWPGENYANPAKSWNINGGLDSGEAVTVSYTYAGYPSTYGSINTKAVVDTGDTVGESNEGNNTLLRNIKVDP
ncbi:MAG: NBR1-Ig-like domain-containing protein [Anaerolineales bacterium]|jgi:hypothetical protein